MDPIRLPYIRNKQSELISLPDLASLGLFLDVATLNNRDDLQPEMAGEGVVAQS